MKVLFKQKQWIVVQITFVLLGIVLGLLGLLNERDLELQLGGLAMSLSFFARNSTVPVFFILFSDLAFNLEYVQGTFLTHLLCGQSRKVWMLKQYVNFYVFVLLQFFITFVLVSLVAGAVTGHFGLEGLDSMLLDNKMGAMDLVKGMGVSVLFTIMLVSLGTFVTTLLPGRLLVGSIISIGAISILSGVTAGLAHVYKGSKVVTFIINNVFLENPNRTSWIYGILWIAIFTWLSAERVKRLEITNRGA